MGNRVRQVPLSEATPEIRKLYQQIFGDRNPVAQPGTATGSPGDYWTTLALVPDVLKLASDALFALLQPGRKLEPRYRELAILRTAIVVIAGSNFHSTLRSPARWVFLTRSFGLSKDGRPRTSSIRRSEL